jgi:hypothetical protein
MTRHTALFMVLMLFVLFGSIRTFDPLNGQGSILVNVNNENGNDLDNTRVRVFIYDLGMIFQTREIDVEAREKSSTQVLWDVPSSVPRGTYWARITVSNDDERHVTHRLLTVA